MTFRRLFLVLSALTAEAVGDGPEGCGFLPDESTTAPGSRAVTAGTRLLIADDYLALADGSLADASTTEDDARVYRDLLAEINQQITPKQTPESLRD